MGKKVGTKIEEKVIEEKVIEEKVIVEKAIEVKNLQKSYGKIKAVNDISFYVETGKLFAFLGPNGAGKTTLFSILTGIIQPNSGQIILNDINITKYSLHERSRMGIIYLPQDSSIFRGLSVEDNILGVLQLTKLSKKEQQKKCDELIEKLDRE